MCTLISFSEQRLIKLDTDHSFFRTAILLLLLGDLIGSSEIVYIDSTPVGL